MMTSTETPAPPGQALFVEDIVCEFPGVRALDGVSLTFQPGKVHAITGENGAGKSTLLKILAGAITPTAGRVRFGSETLKGIRDAWTLGVRTIPQEPALIQDLSVAENIYLGRLPRNRFGVVDWTSVFGAGRTLLERMGLTHLEPRQDSARPEPRRKAVDTNGASPHRGGPYLFV